MKKKLDQTISGEFDPASETRSMESSVYELRSIFIEGTRARLERIDRTLAQLLADPYDREGLAVGELHDQFHVLAGSGATYGFPQVSAVARRAEQECEAVMAGLATAQARIEGWAAALVELRGAVQDRPTPPAGTPATSGGTRIALCADPRQYRLPIPAGALAGCSVETIDSPEQLAAQLDAWTTEAPPTGIVLVPGGAFGDPAAALRALLAHPHADRLPVLVMLEKASLVDRIELIQHGATRIIPRDTPWDMVVTLVALGQPSNAERSTVFVLEHDDDMARALATDLQRGRYPVQAFTFRDLPAMLAAWQERAADLLLVGRDASGVPNLPVVTSLRKRERLRGLPVLVLIDRADPAARRAVFSERADDYVLIPYVREELIARVEVRLELRQAARKLARAQPRPSRAPAAPASPPAAPAPKRAVRVLMADDDPLVAKLLEGRLRAEGWEVVLAPNGEQAERLIEGGGFDLVLLDLNMPFRSGFDLLQWMTQRGLKKDAKVAVLSALNREEAILRAFSLEADDFIAKPFNPEVVASRLRRLLKR